jgi:hypothetical protein
MRHGIALNKIHIHHAWEASECFGVQVCTVSLLVGELVGGEFVGWPEPDSIWQEQESRGIWRNPEESRVNTGIPVPQEFLQKNPVRVAKNKEFLRPPPKPHSYEKIFQKTQEKKSSGILSGTVFFVKKNIPEDRNMQPSLSFPRLALRNLHLLFLKMLITATTAVTFPVFAVLFAIPLAFIVSLRAVSTTLIGWGL